MIINSPATVTQIVKNASSVIQVVSVTADFINSTGILNGTTVILNETASEIMNATDFHNETALNDTLHDGHVPIAAIQLLTVFTLGWVGSVTLYVFTEAVFGTHNIRNFFRRQIGNTASGTMELTPEDSAPDSSKRSLEMGVMNMRIDDSAEGEFNDSCNPIQEIAERPENDISITVDDVPANSDDENPDNEPARTGGGYPESPKVPPNSPLRSRKTVSEAEIINFRNIQDKLMHMTEAIAKKRTSI